jgi:ubiquinone/menaquinone biosynthesis C-methylase UbiE
MSTQRQSEQAQELSPALLFDTINAYQRTAAIKAAIEFDLFTAIGQGQATAHELAQTCGTSERGMRILCDYLVVIGFLTKEGGRYGLTPDAAMFLDRRSPGYMGSAIEFLLSPMLTDGFKDVAAIVRKGGTVLGEEGSLAPEHPMWVRFARAMAPMMALPAQLMAQLADKEANSKLKVLDIAAGHGLFGIAFAQRNPQAEVVAVDWPNVLEAAKENAERAGVMERYSTRAGSAFDVDYGSGYDLVLLTNFLHHFDPPTCEKLLSRVHAALAEGGRAVTLEFVPNEDRVSPPGAAAFSMMMLGSTPSGDAYTFAEFEQMFRNAGFSRSEIHLLPPTLEQVLISYK